MGIIGYPVGMCVAVALCLKLTGMYLCHYFAPLDPTWFFHRPPRVSRAIPEPSKHRSRCQNRMAEETTDRTPEPQIPARFYK
jgi:hypothetical protein